MADREASPFGVWLREQVAARQLSQAELARRAGLSKGIVTQAIYGHRPRVQSCRGLANALGVPVEQVLRAAGHLDQREQGFEIPGDVWDLVRELPTVNPDVRRTVLNAWRAALVIAREQ